MGDKPIYDPRLDDLFGDDIDMLPDAKPSATCIEESATCEDDGYDVFELLKKNNDPLKIGMDYTIIDSPTASGSSHYRTMYHHIVNIKNQQCVFCGLPTVCVVYSTTISEVNVNGVNGFPEGTQFVAMHVCNKCASRIDRRKSLPIVELCKYVSVLEARGSKKGRIKGQHCENSNVAIVAKALENALIHLDGKEIHFDTVTYNPTTKKYFISMLP